MLVSGKGVADCGYIFSILMFSELCTEKILIRCEIGEPELRTSGIATKDIQKRIGNFVYSVGPVVRILRGQVRS